MNYASQLDLDLSALPLDDFEAAGQELAVGSLTAGQTISGRSSLGDKCTSPVCCPPPCDACLPN
jgi:hypothetical protein